MPYTITLTNGTLFATIPDGSINTSSSMTLIGQNYVGGYGQFQDDNFIRLLETGANGTPPSAPLVGQLWYNTTTRTLQVYNGAAFKAISGAVASSTPPDNNSTGDLWFDTVNNQLDVWTGNVWLPVGPSGATGTGAIQAFITDSANVSHEVLELQVSGNTVGIISQDPKFAPYPVMSGFGNIYQGLTLNEQANTIFGTATNALLLNGANNSAFMSTTNNTQTTGTVSILTNSGLNVGGTNDFNIGVANSAVNLKNRVSGSNINIAITNNAGNNVNAISVNGSTGNVSIPNLSTTTLSATSLSAVAVVANNISTANAITAPAFKTATWTITEISGNLFFQRNGTNIAKLDTTGAFTTIGDGINFGTL